MGAQTKRTCTPSRPRNKRTLTHGRDKTGLRSLGQRGGGLYEIKPGGNLGFGHAACSSHGGLTSSHLFL
jgi:hypothetical protein